MTSTERTSPREQPRLRGKLPRKSARRRSLKRIPTMRDEFSSVGKWLATAVTYTALVVGIFALPWSLTVRSMKLIQNTF